MWLYTAKYQLILSIAFAVLLLNCRIVGSYPQTTTAPGFVIAESDGGLSNRLRSLLSFLYISRVLHNNAQLLFVWDVNDACPGHFLQVFEPLSNVTFITTELKKKLAPSALKIYPNSRDQYYTTMFNYDVAELFPKRNHRHFFWLREIELRKLLIPTQHVLQQAGSYVHQFDVCNITSMHIRRSDMWIELKANQRTSYDVYYKWVEARPANESVYLMTDNPKTQINFLQKYGVHKILVYQNLSEFNGLNEDGSLGSTTKMPVDYRFATIEHTMVDVLIAAHAKDFKVSPYSSMSELVKWFKNLYRWDWCNCDSGYCT